LFVSIYGLAAGGARAAMHGRGAPGARGRAGSEKTGFACDCVSVLKTINVRPISGFPVLGLCAAGRNMTKPSIREFKLAGRDGDGLHPCLDERGAFVGDGAALLTKDIFGDFASLPRRERETILSAGYIIAIDLGTRMHGLAALAKALNQATIRWPRSFSRSCSFRPCRTKARGRG